jgi:hypothetical protein
MDKNRELSDQVYWVDEKHPSVTSGEKERIKTNQVIKTKDQKPYLVLQALDNEGNSMQAMAVAPLKPEYQIEKEKKLQKIPGYPNSVVEKNITIAYSGTKDKTDIATDVVEIGLNQKHIFGAFESAVQFATKIENRFPKGKGYTISVTGHSLGGGEAIYVAALKGFDAITYSAAGAGLSAEQIKNFKGTIVNLYDTSDMVTTGFATGGQKRIPFLSIGIDNTGWASFGHSLEQFKRDKKGNYINKYGDIVVYSNLNGGISLEQTILAQCVVANNMQMRRLEHYGVHKSGGNAEYQRLKKENKWLQAQIDGFTKLNKLRKKLATSGGRLSGNEEIYLDISQALMIVELASSKYDNAMENTIKIYKDGLSELEETWQNGLSMVRSMTPDLSHGELMEAMESAGCNENEMVTRPSQEFQEKISEAQQMGANFSSLVQEIKGSIAKLVQQDQALASQLSN